MPFLLYLYCKVSITESFVQFMIHDKSECGELDNAVCGVSVFISFY